MTSDQATKRKTTIKIKLSDMVQPHFYPFWRSRAPYSILNGGRGSFKSSTVSLKIVTKVKRLTQAGHKANVICIRENSKYLRDSIYKQIVWALDMLHMTDEFEFRVSPMEIIHRRTGSTFYFYGAQDPNKLKSNTVRDVVAVWYEEAANFTGPEVFDQANPTFIRQRSPWVDHVAVYYTYNPPKSPYEWINEWIDSLRGDDDYFIDTSTYLDDELGITDEQTLKLIQKYKDNDFDYYRWLYLGEVVGLGTNVYNMNLFHLIQAVPDDDEIMALAFSVDTGHMQSATAVSGYGFSAKGNVYVLDTYYYSPARQVNKKPPSELVKDMHAFLLKISAAYPDAPIINKTIDSAEGAIRNQYSHDYHDDWHPVAKAKEADMIDVAQDLLAQGRVYVIDTSGNGIFMDEHRQYQWDEKTMESSDPKVIKENDHTCDEFKYMCLDNRRRLGLKR
ncbi:PBSX family phage terminase large subunit [Lacticaseibacillus daqingensis]|uniref:PBSX family phage terminase large subunit n=1 Tax=Lacticaseibacillus daqingensis TaxID=2486014 RepID=UPI000F766753|nr:PBSX family phage terminase large subunit [Lacticaseibacillus daqingensis]